MSGIYDGPDGSKLYGDGREVEPRDSNSVTVCTCDDLVNNGDHYCPIHGTFAKAAEAEQPRCTKGDPDFGHAFCPVHGEKCPPVAAEGTRHGFWKSTTEVAESLAHAHASAPSILTQLAVEFLELKCASQVSARCLKHSNVPAAWCHDCLASAAEAGKQMAAGLAGEATEGPQRKTAQSHWERLFEVKKVNMNCFKVYFCGAFLCSRNSEHHATQLMRQITNAIKRHLKGQYFAGYEQGKCEAATAAPEGAAPTEQWKRSSEAWAGRCKTAEAEVRELRAKLDKQIIATADEIQRYEAKLDQWTKWGVVEVAVRNPQVADYCKHWEERAESAEYMLRILNEETVLTGFPSGDRNQTLANVRALWAQLRTAREALRNIAAKECGVWHQGPHGPTCLDVLEHARANPERYVDKFREEILAHEHLCNTCIAKVAVAALAPDTKEQS